MISSKKKLSSVFIAKDTDVSSRIISWRLMDDFSLKSCKPTRKPRLIPGMKVKRLIVGWKNTRYLDCYIVDSSVIFRWIQYPASNSWVHTSDVFRGESKNVLSSGTLNRPSNTRLMSWYGESCRSIGQSNYSSCQQEWPWTVENTLICWKTSWLVLSCWSLG